MLTPNNIVNNKTHALLMLNMSRQSRVLLLAAVSAVMIYFVGVFTGAVIMDYTKERTSQEFEELRAEIDGYSSNLEGIEMEMLILSSGTSEIGCKLIINSLDNVQSDLQYFWDNLPERLEEYESENLPDPRYESLKKDYMEISIKAWLMSLSVKERCDQDITPILYFYSSICPDCIEQGSIIDSIREPGVLVYTIDLNLDSEPISMVKEAYGITKAPSLIVGEDSYQGLVPREQLQQIIEGGSS